jgi:hypothetical protein
VLLFLALFALGNVLDGADETDEPALRPRAIKISAPTTLDPTDLSVSPHESVLIPVGLGNRRDRAPPRGPPKTLPRRRNASASGTLRSSAHPRHNRKIPERAHPTRVRGGLDRTPPVPAGLRRRASCRRSLLACRACSACLRTLRSWITAMCRNGLPKSSRMTFFGAEWPFPWCPPRLESFDACRGYACIAITFLGGRFS